MEGYDSVEERWNVLSHGIGFFLSLIGLVLLLVKAEAAGSSVVWFSYLTYGTSLVLLYGASTAYHSATKPGIRFKLKVLDHIGIFILIAGTYTPFSLLLLGEEGVWVFWGSWGIAIVGSILKLFYAGKLRLLSSLLYLGMGWMIIFVIDSLIMLLKPPGLWLLFAGGLFYSIGVIFYNFRKMSFNHSIFHLFVLFGSLCHYLCIFFFIPI